ncbi:glycosyltransferase family 2 protein [Clostridium sp. AL.422]|uniref:glycosyltransferase family 2 protein n=1 Tax=Clostridium TaxID=1485 RepID=UPI00293DF491|nr:MULTISPECIES: glycosyltransferase family 2 protein [unclassified Clostridium]MDV4150393.1 glycosyltransferase family 2 protein [Clostridium sp. AL.422]
MSRVAIIILNYNTWEYTNNCIDSIIKQDYKNYDMFLVDNESRNDSLEKICAHLKEICKEHTIIEENQEVDLESRIIVIKAKENNGYAAGNNIAIMKAIDTKKYDLYWVINNDTVVEKDTLNLMVECIENDKYRRPVGNFVFYYDQKDIMQMAGGLEISKFNFKPYFSNKKERIDYLGGVSYLIDNKFISKYGLMEEEYFLNSEDLEYFYKYKLDFIKSNKNELPFNVIGKIYHKESATQGKISPMSNYYYSRNLLYSCKKLNPKIMINLYIFFIIRIIKWSILNKEMAKSIILAIRDYKRCIKGKVGYFNKKEK